MKNIQKKLRLKILEIIFKSKASHLGSIFSCIDIIFFIYKNYIFNSKKNKFILSKGHAGLGYFVTLNFFRKISSKLLNTYYKNNSILTGHISHKVNNIDVSTGSLGQGLPISLGFALQKKTDGDHGKVFCLISDGECQEGSNWEAALFAAHNQLNNIIVIIDYNKLQSLTTVKKTINIEPLKSKWTSFGWKAYVTDGHSFDDLEKIFLKVIKSKKPTVVICNTIKGKGSKMIENKVLWHYRCPSDNEYETIKKQISNY